MALVLTSLPTDQRRAWLEVMLQPLVSAAHSLLSPAADTAALDAGRRKDLTLATFDRIAVIFKWDPHHSLSFPLQDNTCHE